MGGIRESGEAPMILFYSTDTHTCLAFQDHDSSMICVASKAMESETSNSMPVTGQNPPHGASAGRVACLSRQSLEALAAATLSRPSLGTVMD